MSRNIQGRIRERILKERGLAPSPKGSLEPKEPMSIPDPDSLKTLAMRLLEIQFGVPIEELLQVGDLKTTARILGIDQSTVSLWRLRLGLRRKKQ